jgi:hypothetical protein
MGEEARLRENHMANLKPWVQAACICEHVLIEPDNVSSLIRVVDTYTLPFAPDAPPVNVPPGVPLVVQLTAFISLKSGDVVGDFEVGLRLTEPDETEQPVRKWPVELRGGEHGATLKIVFALGKPKLGLYWFDVLWEDDVLTRIPFRLKAAPSSESTVDEAAPIETTTH